jgi:hypothetical protein
MKSAIDLIFGLERWALSIATAWVLTRNEEFVADWLSSCFSSGTYAAVWRFDMPVPGARLKRHPVMLFPTAESAAQRLHEEIPHDKWDFSKDEVLALFPKIDDPNRSTVLASVWRGQNPDEHEWLPLSHAAWWLVSEGGSKVCVLDDAAIWKRAFETLTKTIPLFASEPPPYQKIPSHQTLDVFFNYPCQRIPLSQCADDIGHFFLNSRKACRRGPFKRSPAPPQDRSIGRTDA